MLLENLAVYRFVVGALHRALFVEGGEAGTVEVLGSDRLDFFNFAGKKGAGEAKRAIRGNLDAAV